MRFPRFLSLHPRLAATLDGVVAVLLLWWFSGQRESSSFVPLFIFSIARFVWWAGLLQSIYYPQFMRRIDHALALFIFHLGSLFFFVFSDTNFSWNGVAILACFVPAISFWLVPAQAGELSVLGKPHRRWLFLMSLVGVAGIWDGVKAAAIFQVVTGFYRGVATALAVLVTAVVSVFGWRLYGIPITKKVFLALLVLAILLGELAYTVNLWPIGYWSSSLFITWLWLITWLLFRFSLTEEGVDWKKQRFFLASNIVLIILFLSLVVRWK